jgi:hypothetical protein
VIASEAAARAGRLDPARRDLAVRFLVSFFNAFVTAALLGVFYWGTRRLGVGTRAALAAALMLGFTTPLWVYSKSFMAEPLQALGLLLALLGASLAAGPARSRRTAEVLAGAGVLLAVSAKLSMLPLALACLVPLLAGPPAQWRIPLAGLVLALLGHGLYDFARFGTPLETGYGVQATPAAYSTPFLVGLYGLLLSSGKGVMWFAPALWLAPAGWIAMMRSRNRSGTWIARLGLGTMAGRVAWGGALAWCAGLLLYARFQHWAGDGSFGPRYLIPLLPLAFLCVAFTLSPGAVAAGTAVGEGPPRDRSPQSPRSMRAAAVILAVLGLAVQIGGVAIYFGAQMREAGDYPYRLPLEDRRFMSESHFNPNFSPIVGHWRMLLRNAGEHLRGEQPRLVAGGSKDSRLGLSADEQRALLHALDFWWLYLGYAGFPRAPVLAVLAVLVAAALAAAFATRAACAAEERAAPVAPRRAAEAQAT